MSAHRPLPDATGPVRTMLLATGLVLALNLPLCWGNPLSGPLSNPKGMDCAVAGDGGGDPLGPHSLTCSVNASGSWRSSLTGDFVNGWPDTPGPRLSGSPAIPKITAMEVAFRHDLSRSVLLLSPGPMLAARGFDEFAAEDMDRVSPSRAAVLSLVLPGAGQWYAGAHGRAAAFFAAEGLCWVALGFFETVGQAKRADYQVYARVHAGIDPTGKGDDFYRTITFYDSREEYNDLARVYDSRRPYYNNDPYWNWQWDSDASRTRYRALRNQRSEAFNRVKFSLGALALNRVIATLDAIRTAGSVNRRARMETAGWRIHIQGDPVAASTHLAVVLSRAF